MRVQTPQLLRSRRHELGQFFTPEPLAELMASIFEAPSREIRLLDAGAGAGALTAAVIRRCCRSRRKPVAIEAFAFEVDSEIVPRLEQTLEGCRQMCDAAGIQFRVELRREDFIAVAVADLAGSLFHERRLPLFNTAIVNPPYRKLRSDSDSRRLLSSVGIETSNLYTAFLSLIVKLLVPNGEMVSITPRSFCNGPYFRPFRKLLLREMALLRLHVFESRSAAFSRDEVLQENIIVHAKKSSIRPEAVTVSSSVGVADADCCARQVPYSQVVSPADANQFIHLVSEDEQEQVRAAMEKLPASLEELGLSVSTGRVVDFRVSEHLRDQPEPDTVPLIYPCHFNGGSVHWPKSESRKPNAIVRNAATESVLVPAEVFVLTKRFSAKEERRRIVACIFDPRQVRGDVVGFENHLNYFHHHGRGLPMVLARGLAGYLNSSLVDHYFRQFNGHTQVNATDLRSLRYPSRTMLECLGCRLSDFPGDQATLDAIVEEELRGKN